MITVIDESPKVTIGSLKQGQLFFYGSDFWIKCDEEEDGSEFPYTVRVTDGFLIGRSPDTKVVPAIGTLTVE